MYWVFFHKHSRTFSNYSRRKGGISLIPHYHFHPLHIHLDISRAITAESLPLHIPSSRTQTGALFRKFHTPLVSEPGTSLIKQNDNAETRDDFAFQKWKKSKRFSAVNPLSRLNENVLSPNRFEQLAVEDDAKESANVEKYDDNSNNNPTRTTTKESHVSKAKLNLNYSSRPSKIANSQTHLTTHKGPTTVVNRRLENQNLYERKKVVPRRQTYGETLGK